MFDEPDEYLYFRAVFMDYTLCRLATVEGLTDLLNESVNLDQASAGVSAIEQLEEICDDHADRRGMLP